LGLAILHNGDFDDENNKNNQQQKEHSTSSSSSSPLFKPADSVDKINQLFNTNLKPPTDSTTKTDDSSILKEVDDKQEVSDNTSPPQNDESQVQPEPMVSDQTQITTETIILENVSTIDDQLIDLINSTLTATTTISTENNTPPVNLVDVGVNQADMESFEEWKDKMKTTKGQQETVHSSSTVNGGGGTTTNSETLLPKSSDQRQKNYAGLDCGAKLIAHNPESSNANHILSESRDDYMLNSCSTHNWFVIELCDSIKVKRIEIANFELFSNVPRQFDVYASLRYQIPHNKEWSTKYRLGTFEAANNRMVQSFDISESKNQTTTSSDAETIVVNDAAVSFAKYIKFEMLSHYGKEHYCPLSLVRVFGTTIAEEAEAEVEAEVEESDQDNTNANTKEDELKSVVTEKVILSTFSNQRHSAFLFKEIYYSIQ
jgi:hypothetical protein